MELKDRIILAREQAGYTRSVDAARALGIPLSTYHGYENGNRPPSRDQVIALASRFNVSLDWLLINRGEMRPRTPPALRFPIRGFVGAGARVDVIKDPTEPKLEVVDLGQQAIEAYVVKGESMTPRFFPGEIVLFEKRASIVGDLVDQYARLDTNEHGTLVKIVRPGRRHDRWTLESHNAAKPLYDVEVMGAYRFLGLLPAR